MENKILMLFFILIEAVILGYCETDSFDSFGTRLNEKIDPGTLDLSKRKDFYLFENNELAPEVKNLAKRPMIFNDHFSKPADAVNSLEIRQDISRTNLSEKENEMSEFHHDRFNNWQQERNRSLYPNRQENRQGALVGQAFNRPMNPQQWDRSGNFFQNSQSRWNEVKNFRQYQTASDVKNDESYDGRIATVPNAARANVYSDNRNANTFEKTFVNNRDMNGYFQPTNDKVSLTLLNDDRMRGVNNYDHESVKNRFQSQLNSKINYYNRNSDGFRSLNFHNPEKGVIINFNTECSTSKPYSNPIFHKFIFAPKPQIPQSQIPTFQIPETTLITRQMSTPIYYL